MHEVQLARELLVQSSLPQSAAAIAQAITDNADLVQPLAFQCPEYDNEPFKTLQGLNRHRAHDHGYVHDARLLSGPSSVCRVCLVMFQSRLNLIRHLREKKAAGGHTPCLQFLRGSREVPRPTRFSTLPKLENLVAEMLRRSKTWSPRKKKKAPEAASEE